MVYRKVTYEIVYAVQSVDVVMIIFVAFTKISVFEPSAAALGNGKIFPLVGSLANAVISSTRSIFEILCATVFLAEFGNAPKLMVFL